MNGDEWTDVLCEEFDGGIIILSFGYGTPGGYEASINFAGGGIMTADEFRAAADQYEAFPALLRSFADRVDAEMGV